MDGVRGVAIVLAVSSLTLAGCGSVGGVFGGGSNASRNGETETGIGVNAYLWRATLDTLSFMPLLTADPWGGVVNYAWYINPQTPSERFKTETDLENAILTRARQLNLQTAR